MPMSEEILEVGYSNFILLMRVPRDRHDEGLASSSSSWIVVEGMAVFLLTRW